MITNMNLNEKMITLQYILPNKIKKFLEENNLDVNEFLRNNKWEECIHVDLTDEKSNVRNNFKRGKLVISYVCITQKNKIKVLPEEFAEGKVISEGNWSKGTFSKDFSMGYSLFI